AILVKDPGTQEMAINMKHPYLGTGELTPVGTPEAAKWIRQAISHATPRQTIVDQILQGLGAPGVTPMPDASVGFDDTLQAYSYDLDLARQLIEQAGFSLTPTPTGTETTTPTEKGGITGLIFLSFLGLASILAIRRRR
ncbi:MAG: ABC transporter substrate-binding protein, partial [Candidatus Heimdallarchaeaceae archaeon]